MNFKSNRAAPAAIASDVWDAASVLNPGELIEATDIDGRYYHGEVDGTAPDMGIVWINDRSLGFRKLLNSGDYAIRVIRH